MTSANKTDAAIETLTVEVCHRFRNRRTMRPRGPRARILRTLNAGDRELLRSLVTALRALRATRKA